MSEPELRIGTGVPTGDVPSAAVKPQRKDHSRVLLAVLVAVLVLAGIGVAAIVVVPRGEAPTVTASPSPTVKTASVQQWAGALNGPIIEIKESWARYEDEHCAVREDVSRNLTCALGLMGLDTQMQILIYAIDGAAKPGIPGFIGAPPAEVAALVTETRAQAQTIADMIPDDSEEHGDIRLAVFFEMSRMETIMAKWAPYL